MIERLLAVESVDEPTEIVIHVNMLKEAGTLPIFIPSYRCALPMLEH